VLEAFAHSHRPSLKAILCCHAQSNLFAVDGTGYRLSTLHKTDEYVAGLCTGKRCGCYSHSGIRIGFGGEPMREFRMDSTGSTVEFDALSSSHYARHGLSRRAFIGGAAAATGVTLGSGLLSPAAGLAGSHSHPAPRPTTGVSTIEGVDFHFTFFGPGTDPSSITDFKGLVGAAQVQGTGTARHPNGRVETLLFDTDMRFMQGVYVGKDGGVHRGTFGFV